MFLRRARTGVKQRECAERAVASDPGDLDPQNDGNFVSGIRFSRSLQEANPLSIWLKAAFVSGLSYQLVLSYSQQDHQLIDAALSLTDTSVESVPFSHKG